MKFKKIFGVEEMEDGVHGFKFYNAVVRDETTIRGNARFAWIEAVKKEDTGS